jgi:hypothetical protein
MSKFLNNCRSYGFTMLLIGLVVLAGCQSPQAGKIEESKSLEVRVEGVPEIVSIEVPDSWVQTPSDQTPFDLQVTTATGDLNTGVFLYRRDAFQDGSTLQRILGLQVDDLAGKRESWKTVEAMEEYESNGKRIATSTHSGTKDGEEFHYRLSAIEFTDHPDAVVTTLQVGFPDTWSKTRLILKRMVDSLGIKTG